MDREILFRGKRVDDNQWTEGFLSFIYTDGRNSNGFIYTDKAQIYSPVEVRSHDVYASTVGQFTGLCDKDGMKIFEGDVVFAGYGEYYQSHHEQSATMIIDMADYEALNALCNANVVEVIGNIHDTPDLETEEESE